MSQTPIELVTPDRIGELGRIINEHLYVILLNYNAAQEELTKLRQSHLTVCSECRDKENLQAQLDAHVRANANIRAKLTMLEQTLEEIQKRSSYLHPVTATNEANMRIINEFCTAALNALM